MANYQWEQPTSYGFAGDVKTSPVSMQARANLFSALSFSALRFVSPRTCLLG